MIDIQHYSELFSVEWKAKYGAILSEEHLRKMEKHLYAYQQGKAQFELPYFKEEIKEELFLSFQPFLNVISLENKKEIVKQFEEIPIQHWLMVLGQRLTSASIRDENGIPRSRATLIASCQKLYNSEVTIAQRAWEKHMGRMGDDFWGEMNGNNLQKQEKVMEKIVEILDNATWWNVFTHHKHGEVYEVREKGGHGMRWNRQGTQLIGFLEAFINE